MSRDVFISYKTEDREYAERLCAVLEGEHLSCWLASRDIPPGPDWASKIVDGLQQSKNFVLLLSEHSVAAKQVAREVELADQQNLPIFTFRLEDVQPPRELRYFLANVEWLDGFGERFDEAAARLAATIKDGSAQRAPTGSSLASKQTADRVARSLLARKRQIWGMIAAAALTTVGLAVWHFYPRDPRLVGTPVQLSSTIKPVYDPRGFLAEGSLVSDGARIYFQGHNDTGQGITGQVSIAGGDTVPLAFNAPAGTDAVNLFGISPNGAELLLATFFGTTVEGPLQMVHVVGGSSRPVGNLLVHSAAWSPDGLRIAYSRGKEIFLANADGSESKRILMTPELTRDLRWSPDGRVLRFTMKDLKTGGRSIWQVAVDGSHFRAVLPHWSNDPNESAGNWTPDGRCFVFQAVRDGTVGLWALREGGGWFRGLSSKPVRLTSPPMNMGVPVPSRDGKKIFAIGWESRTELQRYDAKSGHFRPYLPGLSATQMSFSRDSQWMAYVDVPGGTLWRSRVDGTAKLQLTYQGMRVLLPKWSPSGNQIVFSGGPPSKPWGIYVVAASGGSPEPVYQSENSWVDPGWSPDGQSVVFGELTSAQASTPAIYILNLKTGKTPSKVAGSDGMYSPRWSPDGRYLAAMTTDSLHLKLFDFVTQEWTEVLGKLVAYPNWSQDSKSLILTVIGAGGGRRQFRLRISDRTLEEIADESGIRVELSLIGPWRGLAPDGSPLVAVDNSTHEVYALDWDAP